MNGQIFDILQVRSAFFLMIIFLLFPQELLGGIENGNRNNELDSLLLQGKIVEVREKLSDTDYRGLYDSVEFHQLLTSLKITRTLSEKDAEIYAVYFRKNPEIYYPDYAGESCWIAYQKFRTLSERDFLIEGLQYYYIARFFKTRYLKDVTVRARASLKRARECMDEKKYDQALEIIKETEQWIGQYSALIKVKDSLETVKRMVSHRNINQEVNKTMWKQQGVRHYQYLIGVGPLLLYQNAVNDETLPVSDALQYFLSRVDPSDLTEISIDYLPSQVRIGASLIGNMAIARKIFLGVDIGYYQLHFKSEMAESSTRGNVFFDLHYHCYPLDAYVRFTFRDKVGLRPYFDFGAGYLYIYRSESEAGTYMAYGLNNEWHLLIESGKIYATSFNSPFALVELGAEYIPGSKSHWLIGSKIHYGYHFREIPFFSSHQVSFLLTFGWL